MKKLLGIILFAATLFLLCGCAVGNKSANLNLSFVYFLMALVALLVLVGYLFTSKKKELYVLMLFTSMLIVNSGYYLLSVSSTLPAALNANRLSYLGSVFLPFSMLMIISNAAKLNCKKWVPRILIAVAVIVFLIAASPGYLNIYYKDVAFQKVNGVTVLNKTYGDWHCIYLFYLLFYFAAMIGTIVHSIIKKKIEYKIHTVFLTVATFINIAVWMFEQSVKIDFEFLSVSYVISGLFVLGLTLMMQESEKLLEKASKALEPSSPPAQEITPTVEKAKIADEATQAQNYNSEFFKKGLEELTKTELKVYDLYIEGKTTKEVMAELNIKENTLKYHNKNIYGKLGVSSRKQLIEIAKQINQPKTEN